MEKDCKNTFRTFLKLTQNTAYWRLTIIIFSCWQFYVFETQRLKNVPVQHQPGEKVPPNLLGQPSWEPGTESKSFVNFPLCAFNQNINQDIQLKRSYLVASQLGGRLRSWTNPWSSPVFRRTPTGTLIIIIIIIIVYFLWKKNFDRIPAFLAGLKAETPTDPETPVHLIIHRTDFYKYHPLP